ncbi:MAG: hypothetical protein HYR60_05520 [Acidobacteria bacterium]|nr:hypothetical protein [Acidobacteriota bacterium]
MESILDGTGGARAWPSPVRHVLRRPRACQSDDQRRHEKVLCAGSGISQEPKALAEAGFEVVALDLSPEALELRREGGVWTTWWAISWTRLFVPALRCDHRAAYCSALCQDGIFLSHCHRGSGKPRHFAEPWFRRNRWTMWSGTPERRPPGRVAWLFTSTG